MLGTPHDQGKAKVSDSLSFHPRRGGLMTETIRWYNPLRRVVEEVPAPVSDAQAIELLSGTMVVDCKVNPSVEGEYLKEAFVAEA
jgi:hypothetical protein